MTGENSPQASRASSRIKQELTAPGGEEIPDKQAQPPGVRRPSRDVSHADDRSGSD